jgi:hypothetical protein
VPEWKYASVDLATNSTTVLDKPALVFGWEVTEALSANACPIKDSSTTVLTVPASSAVGASHFIDGGVRFETSLVVDPDDAGTGTLTVFYRPLT